MSTIKRKATYFSLGIVAFLLFIYIFYNYNPEENPFPKCPFYLLTGLKCPGCGSQRAIYQLLHGHIIKALQYNALLVIYLPIIVFFVLVKNIKHKNNKLLTISSNTYLSWGIVISLYLWWILRNVFKC